MSNNWDTLGVKAGTSPEELEKAYKRLVKENHPDLHPGDDVAAERMKEINAAYTALKKGDIGEKQFQSHPGQGWGFDMSSIFEQMAARMANATIQQVIQIPIRALLQGGNVRFAYQRLTRFPNGMRANQNVVKNVEIPANHPIGQPLVFKHEGNYDDSSRPAGDLILHIRPMSDDEYQIEDTEVHIECKINVFTAMIGGSIEVQGLTGKTLKVNIPSGTLSGGVYRLNRQGMQITKTERGHLFVHILVDIPSITEPLCVEKVKELQNLLNPIENIVELNTESHAK